ncbi:MAG TPA: hypothetical protein VFT74_20300 [Isosphaeraceae bacterium]|nr:hypothetical protein [Isosphaeraceae bacterium]
MTAVFCTNTADRTAETWEKSLAPFDRLEFALSDGAKGIARAVATINEARRDDAHASTLEHGLDVFHTAMEAHRVLARHWRRAEAAWEEAKAADVKVARARQQGVDARGPAGPARTAWREAAVALEQVEHLEGAWRRAHAALELFRANGRLNDRATAAAEITAALPGLPGADWAKVRNFLRDPRTLAFLDRMHRRLESAEPRREWREAMAWRWWLRHRRPTSSDPLTAWVRAVGRDRRLTEPEQASYDRVSAVLEDTFRASSAVECMNSVLRMQQSRHKRMTQPMLDLKRLYWNCHRFRSGPRKNLSPYQALCLELPSCDFWVLPRSDPEKLTQELSTSRNRE